jgi:hypothetical protein
MLLLVVVGRVASSLHTTVLPDLQSASFLFFVVVLVVDLVVKPLIGHDLCWLIIVITQIGKADCLSSGGVGGSSPGLFEFFRLFVNNFVFLLALRSCGY